MLKLKLSNIKFININNFIKKIKLVNEPTYLLGRWCHINVPHCNNEVIERKIDFANNDNTFCEKPKTFNK